MNGCSQEINLLINFHLGLSTEYIQIWMQKSKKGIAHISMIALAGGLHVEDWGSSWQEGSLEAISFVLSHLTKTYAARALSYNLVWDKRP